MSEDELKNIVDLDKVRLEFLIKKLHNRNYYGILEEFDLLKTKFFYRVSMTTKEALTLVAMCKYLMDNGHSESLRLNSKMFYDKYLKGL